MNNKDNENELASLNLEEFRSVYQYCLKNLSPCTSVKEFSVLSSEEAAFRVAIHEFFLQRKQTELIRQGIY